MDDGLKTRLENCFISVLRQTKYKILIFVSELNGHSMQNANCYRIFNLKLHPTTHSSINNILYLLYTHQTYTQNPKDNPFCFMLFQCLSRIILLQLEFSASFDLYPSINEITTEVCV